MPDFFSRLRILVIWLSYLKWLWCHIVEGFHSFCGFLPNGISQLARFSSANIKDGFDVSILYYIYYKFSNNAQYFEHDKFLPNKNVGFINRFCEICVFVCIWWSRCDFISHALRINVTACACGNLLLVVIATINKFTAIKLLASVYGIVIQMVKYTIANAHSQCDIMGKLAVFRFRYSDSGRYSMMCVVLLIIQ